MVPDSTLAIDLHDVRKTYRGRVHALSGIEMQVRRGEIFGPLGPNGAGKSTLVKIIMSVVHPTRAVGTVLGKPVAHNGTLGRIGYLPENHRFPRYLTGRQVLDFFGALAKVDRRTRRTRSAQLLDTVGMTRDADRTIATYSKGMAQRIGLAQALMNDPELVLLDEPTDGVDPAGRRDIREVLTRLRAGGKTVFVNSHLLSELEMVSDRVAILVGGRVARQGTIDELTLAKQRYEIEVAIDAAARPNALHDALANIVMPGLTPAALAPQGTPRGRLGSGPWVELDGPIIRIGTIEPADVQPILDAIRGQGLLVRRVQLIRPSLEELFIDAVTNHVPAPRA